jgi:hypothetical protein
MSGHGRNGDAVPRVGAVIPAAPGWWAIWRDDGGDFRVPVAGWALVEYMRPPRVMARDWVEDGREVVALVPDGESGALAPALEPEWRGLVFEPATGAAGGAHGRG